MKDKNILTRFKGMVSESVGGRACFLFSSYSINHLYTKLDHEIKLPIGVITIQKNHKVKWIYVVDNKDVYDKHTLPFIEDPSLMKKIEKFTKINAEAIIRELKSFDYRGTSSGDLFKFYKKFQEKYEDEIRVAGVFRLIDRSILPKLNKIFKGDKNRDQTISIVSASQKLSFLLEEEIKLLEITSKLKEDKLSVDSDEGLKLINEIYDKYKFGTLGYYAEKSRSKGDYIKLIKERVKNNPHEELEKINHRLKEGQKDRNEILKGLNSKDKVICDLIAESSFLKDYFKYYVNQMIYYSEPLFEEIASRTGKKVKFIKDILPEEVEVLLNGKSIDEGLVEERIKHSVMIGLPNEKFMILVGKDAEEFENAYFEAKRVDEREFKGRSASPGVGRGKVKVVLGVEEFNKFDEGDVLVARNTSPDFVAIMKKASAIVAEAGGLTAHVSVVSREFGIPCVVGIPDIVELLKDGDLVEVDANKGIVKILEKP